MLNKKPSCFCPDGKGTIDSINIWSKENLQSRQCLARRPVFTGNPCYGSEAQFGLDSTCRVRGRFRFSRNIALPLLRRPKHVGQHWSPKISKYIHGEDTHTHAHSHIQIVEHYHLIIDRIIIVIVIQKWNKYTHTYTVYIYTVYIYLYHTHTYINIHIYKFNLELPEIWDGRISPGLAWEDWERLELTSWPKKKESEETRGLWKMKGKEMERAILSSRIPCQVLLGLNQA